MICPEDAAHFLLVIIDKVDNLEGHITTQTGVTEPEQVSNEKGIR